jgi:uncharacterized protein YdeI (YjbR/CyaY-like superfamily)
MVAEPLQMTGRDEWRAWLHENHAVAKEAWLIIRKKHVIGPGVTYDEALEEALCFGWIDSLMHSVDADTFTLRFSPRKPRSIWSESNKQRVEQLIEQGRMTAAGMAAARQAQENGEWDKAAEREDTSILPSDLEAALEADEGARTGFETLAPSHKRQYIYWITAARTAETRRRRVRETLRVVLANRKSDVAQESAG